MTERVTIDVDPSIVEELRGVGSYHGIVAMSKLADAIEAALPKPEPAVGSVWQLLDGSVYARVSDAGPGQPPIFCWRWLRGGTLPSLHAWTTWKWLGRQGGTLVFDGATLEAGE